MPEENEEQNLPGDEAPARWQAKNQNEVALMIAGRWTRPSMLPYYTRTMADPTVAVARLHTKFQNEDASEETGA